MIFMLKHATFYTFLRYNYEGEWNSIIQTIQFNLKL